ncbi:hypothetical protein PRIPAC_94494 [Pristionchus pacificus]|uniref:Uncharacterized protein n=1 Tax=Pristionchus pacificus TaxID=54126 RepID=A0A2A6BBG5_PRIPA|nr:hypothetical protein PRIPAC_94494 [Pristionchus pacificus]|eukprot:PDM63232.1 hypothetical protein PRIPAC_50447 [Pristionchus pacificus]
MCGIRFEFDEDEGELFSVRAQEMFALITFWQAYELKEIYDKNDPVCAQLSRPSLNPPSLSPLYL